MGLMNKVNSTHIGHRIAKLALEILGDDGSIAPGERNLMGAEMDSDSTWTNYYMATVGIAIAGGTANVQRNVIAERGLGLPRDTAADRSK
jgi:alkylation response protein AidB-like acyl-CoA dehydrogenase